jgi:DUF971 family protein
MSICMKSDAADCDTSAMLRQAGCLATTLQAHTRSSGTDLHLAHVAPIVHCVLQLRFSDGYDRGIYPWALLHRLSLARRRDSAAP